MTRVPAAIGAQRDRRRVRQQRDVGVLERGSHAEHLGVGLGVHQAREAVAGRAAHARAVGHVRLVEHHAAGRVERVQARRGEIVGELLDARLVRDGRVRVGRAGGRFGRVLAARAVHLVELLGLACSRAPSPRRRSATRARSRRGGAARRSPLCGSGRARRRRAWSRRRRSSAPAAGRACRRRRTRCPARRSGCRRTRRAADQFCGSRGSQSPRSSSRMRLPDGASWRASVPPPAPLPMMITS